MILVTGAQGQIGSDLIPALSKRCGETKIISTGRRAGQISAPGFQRFEILDVTNKAAVSEIFEKYSFDRVFHLAGILSAKGEKNPERCWDVNINGLRNILDAARQQGARVFWPSSIAVFGPHSPREKAPQQTILDPTTMYGITKVSGELLCQYYAEHFQVDVRSLRYPGIISYQTRPGGGTTDYAVEIFYEALAKKTYRCFVGPRTTLPMLYMPDAIEAALRLMETPAEKISIRTSYNINGISFSAETLAAKIQKELPSFTCSYHPDSRQKIADTWPMAVDDTCARQDWGWFYSFDLTAIVKDMLEKLQETAAPKGPKTVSS